jgi:hypothetical protein
VGALGYTKCEGGTSTGGQTPTAGVGTVHSTTTTAKERLCPFRNVLGEEKQTELDVIRVFRDNRLAKSPEGLSLVYLYYAHSEEITDILSSNPELQAGVRGFTLKIIPLVKSGLKTGDTITLSSSQYQKIVKLMKSVQKESSPGLSRGISFILMKLESRELFKQMRIKIEH